MSSSPTDPLAPLVKFLTSVHENLTRSVWLRVFDHPVADNPESVVIPDERDASNEAEAYQLQKRANQMAI